VLKVNIFTHLLLTDGRKVNRLMSIVVVLQVDIFDGLRFKRNGARSGGPHLINTVVDASPVVFSRPLKVFESSLVATSIPQFEKVLAFFSRLRLKNHIVRILLYYLVKSIESSSSWWTRVL